MKKRIMTVLGVCLVLGLLAGFIAGCSPVTDAVPGEVLSGGETDGEESGITEGSGECPFPDGLVLPQVYILGKIYYSEADLAALQNNVIEPLIEYFSSAGQTVVSIQIDNDNRGDSVKNSFLIDVIVSNNDGDHEPIYMGFLHDKVDGIIPVWEMETID